MKAFFKNIYIKLGQFNSTVLDFILNLGYEFFLYLFLSISLSMSMMIGCPAFISLLLPIMLVAIIEITFKGFIIPSLTKSKRNIKGKIKYMVAAIIGSGIGILLSYAWITSGSSVFLWF